MDNEEVERLDGYEYMVRCGNLVLFDWDMETVNEHLAAIYEMRDDEISVWLQFRIFL